MDTLTRPSAARRPALHVPVLPVAATLFAFGPAWTVLLALMLARDGVWLSPELLPGAAMGALIGLWAPHPASLPSLWTQDARDRILPGHGVLTRAVLLVPVLLTRRGTRLVTAAQLLGLGVGVAVWAAVAL